MENLSIISILGGPGSGKGTQCEELCKVYSICHISVGDVLREETKRKDSPYAKLITRNIKEGKIGPKEMTVGLMKNKIKEKAADGVHVFLLDGFPRATETSDYFEETVAKIDFIVVINCTDEMLVERLSSRGRSDDNLDSIRKRIATFHTTTSKVIGEFKKDGRLKVIDGNGSVDEVHTRLVELVKDVDGFKRN